MMRVARTAPPLVAFYLLTSVATAHAECAWVLWKQTVNIGVAVAPAPQRDTSKLTWEPQAAYEAKKACEDGLAAEQRRLREGGGDPKLVCLPDTVDPRGPKGK